MKRRFIFDGTFDAFNEAVEQTENRENAVLFEKKDGRYSFGVGGGHGGGYWYSPTYVECDGKLLIEGKIRSANAPDTKSSKALRVLGIVLFWYVYLIFLMICGLGILMGRIFHTGEPETPARILRRLMVERLGCTKCRKF